MKDELTDEDYLKDALAGTLSLEACRSAVSFEDVARRALPKLLAELDTLRAKAKPVYILSEIDHGYERSDSTIEQHEFHSMESFARAAEDSCGYGDYRGCVSKALSDDESQEFEAALLVARENAKTRRIISSNLHKATSDLGGTNAAIENETRMIVQLGDDLTPDGRVRRLEVVAKLRERAAVLEEQVTLANAKLKKLETPWSARSVARRSLVSRE